jgi:hypothetical protein
VAIGVSALSLSSSSTVFVPLFPSTLLGAYQPEFMRWTFTYIHLRTINQEGYECCALIGMVLSISEAYSISARVHEMDLQIYSFTH